MVWLSVLALIVSAVNTCLLLRVLGVWPQREASPWEAVARTVLERMEK